jgi:hypothetical protein
MGMGVIAMGMRMVGLWMGMTRKRMREEEMSRRE